MDESQPPGFARRRLVTLPLVWAASAWTGIGSAPVRAAVPANRPGIPSTEVLAGTQSVQDEGAVVTLFPAPQGEQDALTIDSATDTVLFAPAVRDFQRRHPHVSVRYADRQSLDIHARALRRAAWGREESERRPYNPDLLISSSLDLQTQLANDGLALPHRSEQALALPDGAHWRHEVFSLGAEPVVMVYQPRLLPPSRAPQTRGDLLALLRAPDRPLQGRIGMYDATLSGLGYLLATQDARLDSTAGILLAAMGASDVVLGDHIVPLLEKVDEGQLALLYNVPASYAQARIAAGSSLRVIYPQDYTLLTTRAAIIPRTAGQPALARQFLDELLSPAGQALLSRETRLLPIRQAVAASGGGGVGGSGSEHVWPAGVPAVPDVPPGAWRLLVPGLGLLVYLDPLKRQRFLQAWRAAVPA